VLIEGGQFENTPIYGYYSKLFTILKSARAETAHEAKMVRVPPTLPTEKSLKIKGCEKCGLQPFAGTSFAGMTGQGHGQLINRIGIMTTWNKKNSNSPGHHVLICCLFPEKHLFSLKPLGAEDKQSTGDNKT